MSEMDKNLYYSGDFISEWDEKKKSGTGYHWPEQVGKIIIFQEKKVKTKDLVVEGECVSFVKRESLEYKRIAETLEKGMSFREYQLVNIDDDFVYVASCDRSGCRVEKGKILAKGTEFDHKNKPIFLFLIDDLEICEDGFEKKREDGDWYWKNVFGSGDVWDKQHYLSETGLNMMILYRLIKKMKGGG